MCIYIGRNRERERKVGEWRREKGGKKEKIKKKWNCSEAAKWIESESLVEGDRGGGRMENVKGNIKTRIM